MIERCARDGCDLPLVFDVDAGGNEQYAVCARHLDGIVAQMLEGVTDAVVVRAGDRAAVAILAAGEWRRPS